METKFSEIIVHRGVMQCHLLDVEQARIQLLQRRGGGILSGPHDSSP